MDSFKLGRWTQETLNQLQEDYPLVDYASHFWPVHSAAQGSLDSEQTALIERFFWSHRSGSGGSHFTFWINSLVPNATADVVEVAEPLYYAASFGLTQVVKSMLQNGWVSLNDKNGPWYIDHRCGRATSTALQVACWRGHADIVSLLLKAGADPDSRNIVGVTCLDCARRRGHVDIEQLLMNAGATDMGRPEGIGIPAVEISTVRRAISDVLGIDPALITDSAGLRDLGVDSLAAVEISGRVRRETGTEVTPLFFLMNSSIKEIEDNVAMGRRGDGGPYNP